MTESAKQKHKLSSNEIDDILIKVNHINLSAILYSRITRANPESMNKTLARETFMTIF